MGQSLLVEGNLGARKNPADLIAAQAAVIAAW
jgi:hypothetical protein